MLNVDLSIHYDNDLSSIYFENFKAEVNALFLGDRKTKYFVIFENEQIAKNPYFKRYRLEKMKLSELHELSINLDRWWNEGKKKTEVIDDLLTINNVDFYELHYESRSYYDLDYDFEICGYCQGDCVKVKNIGSAKFKKEQFSLKYLKNIFDYLSQNLPENLEYR